MNLSARLRVQGCTRIALESTSIEDERSTDKVTSKALFSRWQVRPPEILKVKYADICQYPNQTLLKLHLLSIFSSLSLSLDRFLHEKCNVFLLQQRSEISKFQPWTLLSLKQKRLATRDVSGQRD